MLLLGVLIAIGAAVAFLVVGALTLFGGVDATRNQVIPGFAPDRPGASERMLALLSIWAPGVLVALLCLLAGIQITRMVLAALV